MLAFMSWRRADVADEKPWRLRFVRATQTPAAAAATNNAAALHERMAALAQAEAEREAAHARAVQILGTWVR